MDLRITIEDDNGDELDRIVIYQDGSDSEGAAEIRKYLEANYRVENDEEDDEEDVYLLVTWSGEDVVEAMPVRIPNYDGDPYGDRVPFVVHSNQSIIPLQDPEYSTHESRKAVNRYLCSKDLDCTMPRPEQTTAALAVLSAATEVHGEPPYTGGCKAFYSPEAFRENGIHKFLPSAPLPHDALIYIMCDGGDFAPLLNVAYEQFDMMNSFTRELKKRGYVIERINHIAYAVLEDKCRNTK